MRELRDALLGVAGPTGPRDLRAIVRVRLPEAGLVHPIRLIDQAGGQTEGLQHLHRSTGDAVSLADLERALSALNHDSSDLGEIRELRCEHQTCWPTADDHDVGFHRQARTCRRRRDALARPVGRLADNRPDKTASDLLLHAAVSRARPIVADFLVSKRATDLTKVCALLQNAILFCRTCGTDVGPVGVQEPASVRSAARDRHRDSAFEASLGVAVEIGPDLQ